VVARALALEPSLLVFDESLSGLDPDTQNEILDLLLSLRRKLGITQILISHDLDLVSEVADSVVVMRDGRIVEHRATKEFSGNRDVGPSTSALKADPKPGFVLSEAE